MNNTKNSSDYNSLYNDLIKFLTILIVVNILMFVSSPNKNKLLGSNYIKFMSYVLLGILTYWLVISKLILFD